MKINGNDILLAIGEIDEKLLAYPEKRSTHYRTMRTLSLVASLILCVSVVLTFYIGVVFKGATKGDASDNYYPGFDSGPTEDSANGGANAPSSYPTVLFPYPTSPDVNRIPGVGMFDEVKNSVLAHIEGGTVKVLLPSGENDKVYAVYEGEVLQLTSNGSVGDYAKFTVHAEGLKAIEYEYEGKTYRINVTNKEGNSLEFKYAEVEYE